MNSITLENDELPGIVFDMGELLRQLEQLIDSRKARGKRYKLEVVLGLVVLAKISGQNKPAQIAEWVKLRQKLLIKAFNLKRASMPSLNTIRRILAEVVAVEKLEQLLRQFLHQSYGGQQSVLVVLDGKSLRGTIPAGKRQGVHLLAAYLPAEGVVLMQVAVAKKENEITAAPRLLAQLDLRHKVVCGDAMFTQRNLSVQILAQGGDFIWFVKENQPQLLADITQFFIPPRKAPGWHNQLPTPETAHTTGKSNGRLEQRRLTVIPDENGFLDWPGAACVFKLERQTTRQRTGVLSQETVYGLTSLSNHEALAAQLLLWTRQCWGIENGLHYRRDKTLAEDDTRMEVGQLAQVMATLNNFIVALASKLGFPNLASAQRTFDAAIHQALYSP
jgi:predicted transposase YbfD/YdcC